VRFDEHLGDRVRALLAGRGDLTDRKMFGGLAFMLHGNMCCGVIGDELVARLGEEDGDAALDEPHTRVMDFTGRPMRSFVIVERPAIDDDAGLQRWVERASAFADTLPAK